MIATQQINSAFGTWYRGETVSADIPQAVLDAWQEAGIVEPSEAEAKAKQPIERATPPKRETTAGRRMQTEPAPHRRFTPKQ